MKPQDFSASHETAASQTSAGFALRILRGWNAGAQIAVPPGETLRVGGREDCDIVLTDDAVAQSTLHIRLARSADGSVTGWQLLLHGMTPSSASTDTDDNQGSDSTDGDVGDDHGDVMPFDTPMHIGQLTVTVSRADASWPDVHLPDDMTPPEADEASSAARGSDASANAEAGGTIGTASATKHSPSGMHDTSKAKADVDGHTPMEDVTAETSAANAMDQANRNGALPGSADKHGMQAGTDSDAASSHASRPWRLSWLPSWLAACIPAWLATRLPARRAAPASSGRLPDRDGATVTLRRRLRRALGRADTAGERDGKAASTGGIPTHWLMAAGALAIIAALVALVWVVPRQAAPALPPDSPISEDIATQVQHALRAGGWIDGIRVDHDPQGRVTVVGWVVDEAARDRLSAALARLTPMPAMRIDIITEAVQAARDTAAHFGPFLTVDAGRIGEIRIRGVILPPTDGDTVALAATTLTASPSGAEPHATDADARERGSSSALAALQTTLRAAIAVAVPNATLNDAGLVTAEGAVQALDAALIAADLPKAAIHWERIGIDAGGDGTRQAPGTNTLGQLVVDAPADTQAERLRRALDDFRQRYGDRVPIRTLIGGSRATFTPALLPFALVAISSGLLPSVVVDGNVRLLPGGSYRGFRLVFVDDATVVFDRETTPGKAVPSQRIVLQR